MFFYSDTAPRSAIQIDVWKMDGTKAYLRHFDNFLFLSFMALNGDRLEKRKAEEELIICKRKLKFWTQHPNYVEATVKEEKEKKIKEWKGRV